MKTLTTALLGAAFLHVSLTFAADGDMKAAFDALQQRHTEALTAATAETTGSVEDSWFLDLKKLRIDAMAKSDTVTAQKIEAMLLAAGRNGVSLAPLTASAASAPEEKKMGLPEKGSGWNGPVTTYSSIDPKKDYGSAEGTITSAEGNTFVLRTSLDEGQIWDWTFRQKGSEIEVTSFNRIRAANWNTDAKSGPVVGITGKGRIENGTITFDFSWPQPGQIWMGTFDLNLAK
jgi:hypothetical protein